MYPFSSIKIKVRSTTHHQEYRRGCKHFFHKSFVSSTKLTVLEVTINKHIVFRIQPFSLMLPSTEVFVQLRTHIMTVETRWIIRYCWCERCTITSPAGTVAANSYSFIYTLYSKFSFKDFPGTLRHLDWSYRIQRYTIASNNYDLSSSISSCPSRFPLVFHGATISTR